MSEIDTCAVINVIKEMIVDRGFHLVNTDDTSDGENTQYSDTLITIDRPILVGENELGKRCYVFWLSEPKMGVGILREIIAFADNDPLFASVIIICEEGNTPFTERKIRESETPGAICVFKTKEVRHNITKHMYVPKHTRCDREEIESLKKRYNITNMGTLPLIFDNDPVVRYYDFQVGDVIRIDRNNHFHNGHAYYRLVVHSPV